MARHVELEELLLRKTNIPNEASPPGQNTEDKRIEGRAIQRARTRLVQHHLNLNARSTSLKPNEYFSKKFNVKESKMSAKSFESGSNNKYLVIKRIEPGFLHRRGGLTILGRAM